MKKNSFLLGLLIIIIFWNNEIKAQILLNQFDFRLGVGLSHIGSGDIRALVYENELNYKYNKYLSSSVFFNFSQGLPTRYTKIYKSDIFGISLFASLFNSTKYEFKLGGGF